MRPTRRPYEQSSVFSGRSRNSLMRAMRRKEPFTDRVHAVTLRRGDVLVVPRHYWHFVRNSTDAISVNLW